MADEAEDVKPMKAKKVEAVAAEAVAQKPYGQNPGDIVEHSEAVGGRYKALGAGKYERLADE